MQLPIPRSPLIYGALQQIGQGQVYLFIRLKVFDLWSSDLVQWGRSPNPSHCGDLQQLGHSIIFVYNLNTICLIVFQIGTLG